VKKKMKKKVSLIQLNKSGIKKDQLNNLLREECENTKGGAKCFQPMCSCTCYPSSDYFEYNEELAQVQYLDNLNME